MTVSKFIARLAASALGLGPGMGADDVRSLARLAALALLPGFLYLVGHDHPPLPVLALMTVAPCTVAFARTLRGWAERRRWRRRWRLP